MSTAPQATPRYYVHELEGIIREQGRTITALRIRLEEAGLQSHYPSRMPLRARGAFVVNKRRAAKANKSGR